MQLKVAKIYYFLESANHEWENHDHKWSFLTIINCLLLKVERSIENLEDRKSHCPYLVSLFFLPFTSDQRSIAVLFDQLLNFTTHIRANNYA